MRAAATALVVLSACGASPASATDCLDAPTQAELTRCAAEEAQAADRALNAAYQAVLNGLRSADDRRRLVEAQRAWLAWRDREAEFLAQSVDGFGPPGSGHSMAVALRRADLTRQRTEQLRRTLREREDSPVR